MFSEIRGGCKCDSYDLNRQHPHLHLLALVCGNMNGKTPQHFNVYICSGCGLRWLHIDSVGLVADPIDTDRSFLGRITNFIGTSVQCVADHR